MNNLKYAPMWLVYNSYGEAVYYHYHDKNEAESSTSNKAILKWVVMDIDYFIGKWQFAGKFAVMAYDTEKQAEQAIKNMVFI